MVVGETVIELAVCPVFQTTTPVAQVADKVELPPELIVWGEEFTLVGTGGAVVQVGGVPQVQNGIEPVGVVAPRLVSAIVYYEFYVVFANYIYAKGLLTIGSTEQI